MLLEQMDLNKRLMIALALSFLILIGFTYLFPNSKKTLESNQTASATKTNQLSVSKTIKADTATPSTPNKKVATLSSNDLLTTVDTKKYLLKIDRFGRFASAVLKDKKYRQDDGKPLDIIDPKNTRPLEVRFEDQTINKEAFSVPYTTSASKVDAKNSKAVVVLTQKLSTLTLTKTLTFYPDGHYTLNVKVTKPIKYFVTAGHRPEADKSRYMIVRGTLIRDDKGVIHTIEDGDAKEIQKFKATILASSDRYYTSLFYNFNNPFSVVVIPNAKKDPLPFVKVDGSIELSGYVGAKEWKLFHKLDPRLTDAVEFGWFTFLSRPFFKVMLIIYNFVGNWGWAIVLFTLLVKLILFPLSYKGMLSMQKLKDLAPKMKEIKERYGKDPAKMNQQMMELYRKHGANPMGGCLPMLLQIPVFFALYRVLLNADELQGASWILWINDLSRQDPYFILPILMGVTMFIQQHITPNTMTDPMQQKIFKWFPALMTFFFLTFPSGLVLYWLTNNILSIAQQMFINSAYEKHKLKMKEEKAKEGVDK